MSDKGPLDKQAILQMSPDEVKQLLLTAIEEGPYAQVTTSVESQRWGHHPVISAGLLHLFGEVQPEVHPDLIKQECQDFMAISQSVPVKNVPRRSAEENASRKIEQFVNSRGMRYAELAGKANIDERTLRSVRSNEPARPDTYRCIAEAMSITREQLLADD